MSTLQEKCCSTSPQFSAKMLTAFALADLDLELERQVTKHEQARVEVEQNLQVARSAPLSAQHSALAKPEEARRSRDK